MSDPHDFDMADAMARVDNNRDLFRELIGIFESEYPQWIRNIDQAIEQKKSEEVIHHSHAMKGALANIGAMRSFETAKLLEIQGREGNLTAARATLEDLERAVSCFRKAVQEALE